MTWIGPETLEGWEDRWNRGTDVVMEKAAKNALMRWTFLPPDVVMDSGYVLRYIGVLALFTIGLQVLAQILILPMIWAGQVELARANHDPAPSASVILAAENRALGHIWLPIAGFVIGFLALNIGVILPRAYFWNRRARRLQQSPPPEATSGPTPGVWPPPPRTAPQPPILGD